jgi:lipopolysaccharide transport system permease protein
MTTESLMRPAKSKRSTWGHLLLALRYHDLLRNLVVRELKARYKNSALGFVWSLLNPLAMMVVFTVVFTVLLPNNSIKHYPIFLLCGLLPWQFFSAGVMSSLHSIVGSSNLVKKVNFPAEVLPTSTVLANLVNFLLALVVLAAVLFAFRMPLSPYVWMLPIVIIIQTCFVLGIGLILATVNVFYRDTIMIMDVVMLAWFFLTPVFYSIEALPSSYQIGNVTLNVHRIMYTLNPMASLIAAYRDLLYWGYRTNVDFFMRTAATSVGVLIFGYWFFTRYSKRFGEEL